MPQRALAGARYEARRARFASRYGREPVSDAYLRFIVEELKPEIDRSYRTMSDAGATVMLGSSMGGLVSIYGLCEYPEVFGGAACLSTSWTVGGRAVLEYLEERVPEPGRHRVYFDHGDEAQIARYEQIQRQADLVFARRGYLRDVDWMSIHFPGEDHSETAWRGRVDLPLRFLLARPTG
jgi:predicted alpha/beta superfamily hydrolase